MTKTVSPQRRILGREALILAGLALAGLLLLPVAIFLIGQLVFGAYDGDGMGGFIGAHVRRFLDGDPATWFLCLSPFLGVSLLRLMRFAWRMSSSGHLDERATNG